MGFFSGGDSNKYLKRAMEYMKQQSGLAIGDINSGYGSALGEIGGLKSDLAPGWQQYLQYVTSGGGLGGLRDLQNEWYNYKGPSAEDMSYDPYRQFMDSETSRNTRMAQAARGVTRSSAGIGQEERALAGNAADAYRFRMGNDQNRLMNAFNMLSGIEGSRYNQLAGLGGMYQGAVGGMSNLYTGQANALANTRMQGAQASGQFQAAMQPQPSMFSQIMQMGQQGLNMYNGMMGAYGNTQVMNSPAWQQALGR